ncbi:LysM peptidoglycan-binding domain-containing protein [Rhizobium sp. P28RR-XV]|uniref:LysM peptidoglycan-binding domain-containing protein n=1 Tax=Rhizobium sp. P28RR-XV TaxID=2726737 RepID=UPI0014576814|nr:LysM peptidoglycan-binding domain-containing protein [Rhizobium sp. P28RR-XV]NLR85757.1 LysM peptidoglycan-binding domain-containing protein [Rhizobium sp. P28RR-XV]
MRALVVILLCAASELAYVQSDPDLNVDRPFSTSTAIDNVKLCDPNIQNAEELSRIEKFFYDFVPERGGDGQDGSPEVTITRNIAFSMPEIGSSPISAKIHSLDHSSCESELKTSDIKVEIPDGHHITVSFHVDVSANDCGWFLGVHYKNYIGSGSADIRLSFVLDSDLQVQMDGNPAISNEHYDTNPFFDFIGAVSPMGTPVAALLRSMVHAALVDNLGAAATHLYEIGNQAAFKAVNASNSSIAAYSKSLDLLGSPSWVLTTDPIMSGFSPGNPAAPTFVLVQRTTLAPYFGPTAYAIRVGEIAYIKDLAIPKPRVHEVKSGESIWRIAKGYRLDPHIYLRVEDINGLRGKPIRPGDKIIVPLLYEACEAIVIQDSLVRPADSVYKINARKLEGFRPKPSDLRSGNLNLIYPYESILPGD